jgi:ribosomal protein S27E
MKPKAEDKCPQCGGAQLEFVEHTAGGRVVRCADCTRVLILRAGLVAPTP